MRLCDKNLLMNEDAMSLHIDSLFEIIDESHMKWNRVAIVIFPLRDLNDAKFNLKDYKTGIFNDFRLSDVVWCSVPANSESRLQPSVDGMIV